MKLVKAYIRPILLEEVYKSLRANDHCCITVFKGEGAGKYSDPEKSMGHFTFPLCILILLNLKLRPRTKMFTPS